jgi:uncharacterized membrane protein
MRFVWAAYLIIGSSNNCWAGKTKSEAHLVESVLGFQIDPFWQGVIASVVGGAILIFLGFLLKFLSATFTSWTKEKEKSKAALARALTSGNDLEKSHAGMRVIFHVLKWLFIANALWMFPETFGPFLNYALFFLVELPMKVGALLSFILGMRWIAFYAANAKY